MPPGGLSRAMTAIAGLGEVAFRTERLDEMVAFYGDVLGFDRLDAPPYDDAAFFRVADGVAGHTQVLVLFDRTDEDGYTPPDIERTTVDHVAFGVAPEHFDAEAERLESLGYDLRDAYHDWVEWRSVYLDDPDGNSVELVCFDPPEDSDEDE
jgi:catechol 2,3-dioxygenase